MGEETFAPTTFYMDDVFVIHVSFHDQWLFIRDHLLPRLSWARLRLTFKKVCIGFDEITAVGVVHRIHGRVAIKPERAAKLREWPVPLCQKDVRAFLGALGPCRRWIPNLAEVSRPLTRLTGKVPWKWGPSEALSFTTLRESAATALEMHGHRYDLPVNLYSDASGYGGGCVIMQVQDGIEVPILYDSFLFSRTQRNYGTYKRELLTIVEFCRKHSHFFLAPKQSVIFTDHRPLTWFLDASHAEGIYARWLAELRSLNIRIEYVPGRRNAAADALSRTIFPSESCDDGDILDELGSVESGIWVWKDGSGGYEALLKSLPPAQRLSVIEGPNPNQSPSAVGLSQSFISEVAEGQPTYIQYLNCEWYKDVVAFLLGSHPARWERHERRRLEAAAASYRLEAGHLYHRVRDEWLRCLRPSEVREALEEAHDRLGHFGPFITQRRLLQSVWWPRISSDVVDYIAGCTKCAQFGPAKPEAPSLPTNITCPFQLVGADFVGPLPTTDRGNAHIFVVVDYFSRYVWAFPVKTTSSDCATASLQSWLAIVGTTPLAFYLDPGSAFVSHRFRAFAAKCGIAVVLAPAQSHSSVGKVETVNRILQSALKKSISEPSAWDLHLNDCLKSVNTRHIRTLGYSPFEILHGCMAWGGASSLGCSLKANRLLEAMSSENFEPVSGTAHADAVAAHVARAQSVAASVRTSDAAEMTLRAEKHELRPVPFAVGDLVMLAVEGRPAKLEPKWRGPFFIRERVGRASYLLSQLNGAPIPLDRHENHLKPFRPRVGYLRKHDDNVFPFAQKLRPGRKERKRQKRWGERLVLKC